MAKYPGAQTLWIISHQLHELNAASPFMSCAMKSGRNLVWATPGKAGESSALLPEHGVVPILLPRLAESLLSCRHQELIIVGVVWEFFATLTETTLAEQYLVSL